MLHSFIVLVILTFAVLIFYKKKKKKEFRHWKHNLKIYFEMALIAHIMVFFDKILDKIF